MITVDYYRYPRTRHRCHHLTRLGTDGHGTWLGGPGGAVAHRGDEQGRCMGHSFVQLIPPDRWWSAIFNRGLPQEVCVEVTTAATWPEPDRVEMIDLDLAVVRLQDGSVYVAYEDEFEDHRVRLGYPPRMVDSARATAAELSIALERAAPPFDGSALPWLDMLA